jgi:hypothetical protein
MARAAVRLDEPLERQCTAGGRERGGMAMARRRLVFALSLAVPASLVSARAALAEPPAREPESVTPYANRGMMYGPAQGGFGLTVKGNTAPINGNMGSASLNLAVGITPWLTLEGSLGTLSFDRVVRYHDPRLGLWIGLVDTDVVEVDLTASTAFGTGTERAVHAFEPGVVSVFRLGGDVRIDAAAYVPLMSADEGNVVGLHAPVQLALQLTHDVHLALSTGIDVADFTAGVVTVPLGVTVGYTIPLGSGGYVMLSPSLAWPRFLEFRSSGVTGPGPLTIGFSVGIVTPP